MQYLGPPVDMWAYGALVFEMLHGKPAFHGNTLPQLEQRIRAGGAHLPYGCGGDARALVQACLAERPAQRLDAHAALRHRWLAAHEANGAAAAAGG